MIDKKVQIMAVSLFSFVVPTSIVFAAPANFKALVGQFIGLVNLGTTLLFSVAIVFFFASLVKNLWGYDGGNAEQRAKLQQTLYWGILIIFVMVSIWGIISVLQQTLSRGLV
ncbi:hypothetical protein JXR01_01365 [Candidatus Kaiserbacteria bacterium]|nr:MAG: hypothetical protein JXR01_01365 [Candidatus Kaiserbacteria bacterium]